ncbi:hypothetical protein N7450_008046 [Penicillium hetheringtonii]|uniref:Uncharacterized protein n=1 Tax=Penicillium hetheringtonii TaxID=911720 RepID=A0AAD6DFK2_9EURO|nr:hypothetical protein N7450_008046 [Penicillium hetheringtonii]
MGRFALTVQAAFLLGKVLRNFRAPTGATDGNSFHEEEANILDKAILALTQVSLQESRQRTEAFHSTKLLYLLADDHSARLILNTQMLSWLQNSPDHEVRTESILNTRLAIASEMLGLARTINRTGLCGREESSPFCLDAMYRSALIYGQLSQNTVISDARGALDEIKRGLEANNRRWKAAGTARN